MRCWRTPRSREEEIERRGRSKKWERFEAISEPDGKEQRRRECRRVGAGGVIDALMLLVVGRRRRCSSFLPSLKDGPEGRKKARSDEGEADRARGCSRCLLFEDRTGAEKTINTELGQISELVLIEDKGVGVLFRRCRDRKLGPRRKSSTRLSINSMWLVKTLRKR